MVTVNEALVREILERLTRLETLVGASNTRIDDTNKRIDDTNALVRASTEETNRRIDALSLESARRFDQLTARMDRLFYTMLGLGAAIIAALVAGQVLD